MNDETTMTAADTWSAYHVAAGGCTLRHPPDWMLATGMFGTIVAVLAPPRGANGFRSNFNVVHEVAEQEVSQEERVAGQLGALNAALEDVIVLESEATEVAGRAAARALVTYRNGELELTLEQWSVPVDTGSLVVSATAQTADFPRDRGMLRELLSRMTFDD